MAQQLPSASVVRARFASFRRQLENRISQTRESVTEKLVEETVVERYDISQQSDIEPTSASTEPEYPSNAHVPTVFPFRNHPENVNNVSKKISGKRGSFCHLCKCECGSDLNLAKHLEGKSHMRKVRLQNQTAAVLVNQNV